MEVSFSEEWLIENHNVLRAISQIIFFVET